MVWKKIGPNVHEFLLVSGFEVAIEFDFRFSGHSFNGQDVDRTTAAGVEAALRRQIEWKALTVYDYEHPPKEAQWPAPLDAASPGQFYALGLPVGQKVLKRPIQIVNVWYRRGQLA
jgi:hypothetical protein